MPAIKPQCAPMSASCGVVYRLCLPNKLAHWLSLAAVVELRAGSAQADSLDVALEIVNSNTHGNGTAIFTRSGSAARKFQNEVQVMLALALRCASPCTCCDVCA